MKRAVRVEELEYVVEVVAFPDGPGSRPWRLLAAEAPEGSRLHIAKTVSPDLGYVALAVIACEGETFAGSAATVRLLLIPNPRVSVRAVRSVFQRGRVTKVLSGECPAEFYAPPSSASGRRERAKGEGNY